MGDHGSSQNQHWRIHGFQALQRELLGGSDAATPPRRRQAEAEKGGTFFYGRYSNSWMVYNGKSEHKMDDWGNPGLNRTNMDDLGGPKSWRCPNSWMDGWFMENPKIKWMMTGGTAPQF